MPDWIKQYEHLSPDPDTIVVPIEGFRIWYNPDGTCELQSLNSATIWPKGKCLEAQCPWHSECGEAGDGRPCAAGIYAYRTMDEAAELYYCCLDEMASGDHGDAPDLYPQSRVALGRVYLWGRVLECKNGFRAEYAYPSAIYDTAPNSSALAGGYGVRLAPKPPGLGSYYSILRRISR